MSTDTLRVAVLGTRFGALTIEEEELAPLGVELMQGPGLTPEAILDVAAGAVAILAGSPPRFGREVLARLAGCKAIVRYGVGVETIDLHAAAEYGITVANVPDYCAEEVATHTVALALACVRKLLSAHRLAAAGRWELGRLRPLFSTEEQVMGLVGFGRIGQAVARKARAFGYTILVHDPYASAVALAETGAARVELPELLRRSDVVCLHAPLTEETYHLIDGAALALMKPTACLVNTSRGGLIDEVALELALAEGRLAAAGLDVMECEPVPADHPLLRSEHVIVTPHMAWYTEQATARMRRLACREVARVLRSEPVLHSVLPR